jgi:uncharacterized membrane protein required for colicin V production
LVIDIFLVVSIVLAVWFGWSAGLTRTFFAVLAGFLAIFATNKYPYQEGLNPYFIFAITALFIIMLGAFILRMISFFYLNIFDRTGGAVLSVSIWLVVSINIIIPTMTHGTHLLDGSNNAIYSNISRVMQSKIHMFKDYIPPSLERRVLERQK